MCGSARPARHNTTAIDLCRRLLADADLANIHITWIKVRGHSAEAGNDMTDATATEGMYGMKQHVLPVAQYVNDLMGRMAWREDATDAVHDPTVMDAISEADTNVSVAPT